MSVMTGYIVVSILGFLCFQPGPVHALSFDDADDTALRAAADMVDPGDVGFVNGIEKVGSAEWVVAINDIMYVSTPSGLAVRTVPYLAKLSHNAQWYEFLLPGPELDPSVSTWILEQKDLAKDIEKWRAKFSDVSFEVEIIGHQPVLKATYNFTGVDKGTAYKRLQHIFESGHRLLRLSREGEDKVKKERWKSIENNPLTEIDNGDLMLAIDTDLSDFEEESETAKVGYYHYTRKQKYNLEVINNGNEVIFAHYFEVGEDQIDKLLPDVQAFIAKKPVKDAPQTVALEDPEAEGILSVRAVYPLSSGGVTGKHLRKGYEHFKDDFSDDLYKTVWKTYDGEVEAAWTAMKDQKPTYIKKDELETLLDDDFTDVEGESADGKEGFYEFTLDDKLNVEVTNAGDRLVFGLYWEMPDEVTLEQSAKVVDRVNAYLARKNVKHYPALARVYPEYE